jgi:hypothetical protein
LHGFAGSRRRIWLVEATNGVDGRRSSGAGCCPRSPPTQGSRRGFGYILATSEAFWTVSVKRSLSPSAKAEARRQAPYCPRDG